MNIIEVVPGQIYRGPQPVTVEDWEALSDLDIRFVLKLNFVDEGSDKGAFNQGMAVGTYSMPPRDFIGSLGAPDAAQVAAAVEFLTNQLWRPIYVHCTHGQDRTGLVIGEYRVLHQGWSTWKAFAEMLQYGFHPGLPDLMQTWIEFCLSRELQTQGDK